MHPTNYCSLLSFAVILMLGFFLQNALPDLLCVVQVALEGAISKKAALNSLAQGNLPQVHVVLCLDNQNVRLTLGMSSISIEYTI